MLSLASYLDEHSAKLKREALGHIQVGVVGAAPNHFHPFLVQNFGYSSSDDVASEISDTAPGTETGLVEEFYSQAQQAVSQVVKTSATKSGPTGGGDAANKPQPRAKYISPALTKVTVFKPGVEEKFWSHTRLAKEYMPHVKEGKYSCPLCPSYKPRSNLDTVVTHIRRDHLNVSIGCYYCNQSFFSSEGWKKHLVCDHKKEKRDFVPLEMVESEDLEFPNNSEIEEVKKEEAVTIEQSIGLASATNLDIEPDLREVLEVMDTNSEQQGS